MVLPLVARLRHARVRAAVGVPISQVMLAVAGYVLLALAARTLPAGGFATVSAFYLLLNTVGRGVFASVELETSRAMSAARAAGVDSAPVLAEAVRRTAVLLVLAVALSFSATPLLPGVEVAAALALGSCAMALSYGVRGPLAASRRYGAYSSTFFLEGSLTILGAVALAVGWADDLENWIAVLVLSPALAAAVVTGTASRVSILKTLRSSLRPARTRGQLAPLGRLHRISMPALLWTSLFYLSSQGVWNLAPVAVTAALPALPTAAAGFVAVAVVLRAPVFVFPAIQAVMLPAISAAAQRDDRTGSSRALRPLLLIVGVLAAPWVLCAVLVVPWLARLAFAVEIVPPWPASLALAMSTVVGAGAFVVQTRVLAFGRHRDIGLAWFAGLVVLAAVSFFPADPQVGAAFAQLAASIAVMLGVLAANRRVGST